MELSWNLSLDLEVLEYKAMLIAFMLTDKLSRLTID